MNFKLNKSHLASNSVNLSKHLDLPNSEIFDLPEKVLQFGSVDFAIILLIKPIKKAFSTVG
jgi:hypothetical protein